MNNPTFPIIRLPLLDDVELPTLTRVSLSHRRGNPIGDVTAATVSALASVDRLNALAPGARVAVGIGSRGISNIDRIAATTVAYLKDCGFVPFIVPAMASHGGGTIDGQLAILKDLGITEESVGAPIEVTMEVVEYGHTSEGIPCCFDRLAAAADGAVVVNRVKPHTSFIRPIESGLTKMVAIGLGKAEGAKHVHRLGVHGLAVTLPEIAEITLANAPIVCGLALVENGYEQLVRIEGVAPEDFMATDKRLLEEARSFQPRLPFDHVGGLIVEWIGKDISGAGLDPAVTGRYDFSDDCLDERYATPDPDRPVVVKIGVLGVTPASHGNGEGIGSANYTTRAVVDGLDLYAIYFNSMTAGLTAQSHIPVVLPDERDVVRACAAVSWALSPAEARLCVIRSTLHLDEILISPALLAEVEGRDDVTVLSGPEPIRFSEDGELLSRVSTL
jgi:hypothetical protein